MCLFGGGGVGEAGPVAGLRPEGARAAGAAPPSPNPLPYVPVTCRHPEKNAFEWTLDKDIPHDPDAIVVTQVWPGHDPLPWRLGLGDAGGKVGVPAPPLFSRQSTRETHRFLARHRSWATSL